MIARLLIKLGIWSEPATGVYWDCPDCGCLMESDTDPETLFCGGCKKYGNYS